MRQISTFISVLCHFLNSSSSFDSLLSFLGLVAMILPAAAFATFIFCTADEDVDKKPILLLQLEID